MYPLTKRKKMKVIIAGSRDFNDYRRLKMVCDFYLQNETDIEVVSGTAKGADKLGEQYAKELDYKLTQFPANWDEYGRAAGFKRNLEMANYADCLIAFWDGESKGTKMMIELAEQKGLNVRIVKYEGYE